jgi:hypothetical protein
MRTIIDWALEEGLIEQDTTGGTCEICGKREDVIYRVEDRVLCRACLDDSVSDLPTDLHRKYLAKLEADHEELVSELREQDREYYGSRGVPWGM